jgi:hypothetical protein
MSKSERTHGTIQRSNPIRLMILTLLIGVMGLVIYYQRSTVTGWERKALVESRDVMQALSIAPNSTPGWPPTVGRQFPAVSLFDHLGNNISPESWRGKPTFIEIISMTCAGCQAFSGANKYGAFANLASQDNLDSIEEYYRRFTGGHELFSDEIRFVQLIIYNQDLNPPRPEDLAKWRSHFKLDQHANTSVLSAGTALANSASFRMIPGFMLLDAELKVLFDSTGHQPRHNLYTELLPAVGRILP